MTKRLGCSEPATPDDVSKHEAVLLMVQGIIEQLHRSPGLGNGPFSLDGWKIIRDALETPRSESGAIADTPWLKQLLFAREWYEGNPEGALDEIEHRVRVKLKNAAPQVPATATSGTEGESAAYGGEVASQRPVDTPDGAATSNDKPSEEPFFAPGDLLPCPHCGGEADVSEGSKANNEPWWYVECINCGANTEPEVWNQRCARSAGTRRYTVEELEAYHTAFENTRRDYHRHGNHEGQRACEFALEAIRLYQMGTPQSASEACIERCEKYLHGEAIGSICGLRKLERENATNNTTDRRVNRG